MQISDHTVIWLLMTEPWWSSAKIRRTMRDIIHVAEWQDVQVQQSRACVSSVVGKWILSEAILKGEFNTLYVRGGR